MSSEDLTVLAETFVSRGLFSLHVTHGDDGVWRAILETADEHAQPERLSRRWVAIAQFLPEAYRLIWLRCSKREFNIGYECENGTGVLNHPAAACIYAAAAYLNMDSDAACWAAQRLIDNAFSWVDRAKMARPSSTTVDEFIDDCCHPLVQQELHWLLDVVR